MALDPALEKEIEEANQKRVEEWNAIPDVYEGTVYFYHVCENVNYGFEGCVVSTYPQESTDEETVTLEGTFEGKVTGDIARYLNKDGSTGYGGGE